MRSMAFEQHDLWKNANERIPWHEKLEGEDAIQNRVHEYVLSFIAICSLIVQLNKRTRK